MFVHEHDKWLTGVHAPECRPRLQLLRRQTANALWGRRSRSCCRHACGHNREPIRRHDPARVLALYNGTLLNSRYGQLIALGCVCEARQRTIRLPIIDACQNVIVCKSFHTRRSPNRSRKHTRKWATLGRTEMEKERDDCRTFLGDWSSVRISREFVREPLTQYHILNECDVQWWIRICFHYQDMIENTIQIQPQWKCIPPIIHRRLWQTNASVCNHFRAFR